MQASKFLSMARFQLQTAGVLLSAGRYQLCSCSSQWLPALGARMPASCSAATCSLDSLACSSGHQIHTSTRSEAEAQGSGQPAPLFVLRTRTKTRTGYRESVFSEPGADALPLSFQTSFKPLQAQEHANLPKPDKSPDQPTTEGGARAGRTPKASVSWEAHRVLAKLVGGLTKDGKKSVAQGIVRDALSIMQAKIAASGGAIK